MGARILLRTWDRPAVAVSLDTVRYIEDAERIYVEEEDEEEEEEEEHEEEDEEEGGGRGVHVKEPLWQVTHSPTQVRSSRGGAVERKAVALAFGEAASLRA